MQSELQVWQVALCETMSSFESEVNNWHRHDPWRTMRSLFAGVCCCLRAEKIHPSFCKSHIEFLNCRFSSFIPVSFTVSINPADMFAQFCKLQPATFCPKRSVEIFMWQVWFFSPLHKSQESSAARTKAADSQRNVVQARKINLLAPNCSTDYYRNINYIIYNRVPFSSGFFFF